MRDEELAAAGICPVERHPDRPAEKRLLVALVANRVAGTSFAVATWIAALDDEVGHHPMDGDAVEESLARERDEVLGGQRRVEHSQLNLDGASIGVEVSLHRD